MNITTINGVTVVGSDNMATVVNIGQTELADRLESLENLVSVAEALEPAEKLDALGDIATIRSQRGKTSPNPVVIKTIRAGLQTVLGTETFAESLKDIATLVEKLEGVSSGQWALQIDL